MGTCECAHAPTASKQNTIAMSTSAVIGRGMATNIEAMPCLSLSKQKQRGHWALCISPAHISALWKQLLPLHLAGCPSKAVQVHSIHPAAHRPLRGPNGQWESEGTHHRIRPCFPPLRSGHCQRSGQSIIKSVDGQNLCIIAAWHGSSPCMLHPPEGNRICLLPTLGSLACGSPFPGH